MPRSSRIALLLCLAAVVSAHGQPRMHRGQGMRHGGAGVSMVRHHFVMQNGIGAEYADKTSPLDPTADDLATGRALYQSHCAACHGPQGAGDGEAGAALSPRPANLAFEARRRIATDAYLYWTIAEGGAPVGSAMPPFKAVLGEIEIWRIIAHLREL